MIGVFGDIDWRGNTEDRLRWLQQTGSIANYISLFNKYAAQVDWNEASLMACFRKGLKDEILDLVATAESQPCKLQEWMAMASRIDEQLWTRRHGKYYSTTNSTSKTQSNQFLASPPSSSPIPMELDAIGGTTPLAKTTTERLEFQR